MQLFAQYQVLPNKIKLHFLYRRLGATLVYTTFFRKSFFYIFVYNFWRRIDWYWNKSDPMKIDKVVIFCVSLLEVSIRVWANTRV